MLRTRKSWFFFSMPLYFGLKAHEDSLMAPTHSTNIFCLKSTLPSLWLQFSGCRDLAYTKMKKGTTMGVVLILMVVGEGIIGSERCWRRLHTRSAFEAALLLYFSFSYKYRELMKKDRQEKEKRKRGRKRRRVEGVWEKRMSVTEEEEDEERRITSEWFPRNWFCYFQKANKTNNLFF